MSWLFAWEGLQFAVRWRRQTRSAALRSTSCVHWALEATARCDAALEAYEREENLRRAREHD